MPCPLPLRALTRFRRALPGNSPAIFYERCSGHGLDLGQASAAPALLTLWDPAFVGPCDRQDMLAAVGRTSTQSLQRRFFVPKRGFTDKEVSFFINIDFSNHVALVAHVDEDGDSVIAGGGRYIIVRPGQAELAFVVVDAYQGKGIATILMRHLLVIAREAGLKELTAEVLPENAAMLKVFSKFGFRAGSGSDPQVRHLTLQLA